MDDLDKLRENNITPKQVAYVLRCGTQTVYSMIANNEIKAVRFRGKWYIHKNDFIKKIESIDNE